jgi:sugar phosphate permease
MGYLADVMSRRILIVLSMAGCGVASILVGSSGNIWVTAGEMILIGVAARAQSKG